MQKTRREFTIGYSQLNFIIRIITNFKTKNLVTLLMVCNIQIKMSENDIKCKVIFVTMMENTLEKYMTNKYRIGVHEAAI